MLALLGAAAGIGILALGFLSAALYLALIDPLGTPIADLVTGGVLIVAAALLLLVVKLLVPRPRRPPEASAPPDRPVTAAKLGEILGEEGGALIKGHPATAIFAALAAGFVVGSSPKIRAKLMSLLQ
jgi:hypothetical protein